VYHHFFPIQNSKETPQISPSISPLIAPEPSIPVSPLIATEPSPLIAPETSIPVSPLIAPIETSHAEKRIMELEEQIFKLETKLKDKDSRYLCCYGDDDDDDAVTGRGRTNPGYEQIKIENEYFTPPDKSIPIPFKPRSGSSSNRSSLNSFSEKISSWFSFSK